MRDMIFILCAHDDSKYRYSSSKNSRPVSLADPLRDSKSHYSHFYCILYLSSPKRIRYICTENETMQTIIFAIRWFRYLILFTPTCVKTHIFNTACVSLPDDYALSTHHHQHFRCRYLCEAITQYHDRGTRPHRFFPHFVCQLCRLCSLVCLR